MADFQVRQMDSDGYARVIYPRKGVIGWVHGVTEHHQRGTSNYTGQTRLFTDREVLLQWLKYQTTISRSQEVYEATQMNFWDEIRS